MITVNKPNKLNHDKGLTLEQIIMKQNFVYEIRDYIESILKISFNDNYTFTHPIEGIYNCCVYRNGEYNIVITPIECSIIDTSGKTVTNYFGLKTGMQKIWKLIVLGEDYSLLDEYYTLLIKTIKNEFINEIINYDSKFFKLYTIKKRLGK